MVKTQAQDKKAESKNTVRVLTFNILHGATTQGSFDLDVIAKVINDVNPDLVALQEVDFKTNRAHKLDLTTELALRTKMTSLFAKAMDYDGGEYGEAILSKYSFIKTRNVPLPHSHGNEPKAAVEASLVLASADTIIFIATHLDHLKDGTDRYNQAKMINELFPHGNHPMILAGDLNDVPKSKTIKLLKEEWGASFDEKSPEPTFPSNNPKIKIDYIMFYPKDRWKVIETKVIQDSIASDHCAYLSVLQLLPDKN
jgi:endonuclease/exonuclease/phosphatase family metal-dependent hydrolase